MPPVVLAVVGLLVTGSAHAALDPFRSTPPASLRLLDAGLQVVAQDAPGNSLTSPPLIPAPGGDAERPASPTPELPRSMRLSERPPDPYSGTFSGTEVGLGALAALVTDAVTVVGVWGLTLGLAHALRDPFAGLGVGVLFGLAVEIALVPLAVAWAVRAAAPTESNNGFGAALLAAYATNALTGAVLVGISIVSSPLIAAVGTGPLNIAAVVVFATLHYLVMPLAASYAIHWMPRGGGEPPRRTELMPSSPSEHAARAPRTSTSPLFSLAF